MRLRGTVGARVVQAAHRTHACGWSAARVRGWAWPGGRVCGVWCACVREGDGDAAYLFERVVGRGVDMRIIVDGFSIASAKHQHSSIRQRHATVSLSFLGQVLRRGVALPTQRAVMVRRWCDGGATLE
jgi:hypothetical protein